VILNTTTAGNVTHDLQHTLFFSSPSSLWKRGGLRRSGEFLLATCFFRFLGRGRLPQPLPLTPPVQKRGVGEESYVTACRRSRRRRGKDRERAISLTSQLRPQNRRRDTPILKNPQQWQPPRTAASSSSSSSLFLTSCFAYALSRPAQSLLRVY
jgi:hypothetical protein